MKRMRGGSGLVLGVLWLLMADLATAGDYLMVIGKGVEVCEAYLKNLNSFPNHPPMVCERPLNPSLKELSKPAWKELDGREHLELLKQIWRSFDDITPEQFERSPLKDQWIASLKKPGEKGGITIHVAELDVDRDGVPEPVLRYDASVPCDPLNGSNFANPAGTKFYRLTQDQRKIDTQKTQLAFPGYGGRADVFVYNEMWYLTTWAGNLNFQGGQLDVHTVQPIPRRPCEFKYKGQVARRQP